MTGRAVDGAVDAREALAIGLANRIAPPNETRAVAEAEALACDLAALPQAALRADLRSVHENAFDGDLARALQREGANGYRAVFDEGLDGAARFASRGSRAGD